eukprot:gene7639-7841_t
MHNWDPSDEAGVEAPACSAAADLEDAKEVAAFLKIPLYEADFVSKYWNNVFEQFLEGLEQGLTPNPDLACHLTKSLVRSIAAAAGLAPALKRSSAGICFIGRRSFGRFLENYLRPRPGVYVDVMSGKTLGPCSNMLAVTIGQHAVGLGGQKARMYVAGKDLQSGVVYVAAGLDHPALFSSSVLLQQPNWVAGKAPLALNHFAPHKDGTDNSAESPISGALRCDFKARYRQVARQCDLVQLQQLAGHDPLLKTSRFCGHVRGRVGSMLVGYLGQPSRAVTPGQAFVMYDGEVCLGSAVIAAHGPTLFEQQLP